MKNDRYQDREGKKIRRQFFNGMIFNIFIIVIYSLYIISMTNLLNDNFVMASWFETIKVCVIICLILSLPFIVLSILNRRYFGEIICVINEHGIYYENGFLYWSDIDKIVYECPTLSKRFRYDPCCVEIHTKNKTEELIHAPLYLLFVAKRVEKNVNIKLSKESKWYIAVLSVIFLAFPFVEKLI